MQKLFEYNINLTRFDTIWNIILDEAAFILSGLITYVYEGELINITCIVEGGLRVEPPEQIFWYHDGEVKFEYWLRNVLINLLFHSKEYKIAIISFIIVFEWR